eukprot:CAMPEP_0116010090 /NCGR_PEP_ID=MMETSP0321-20121206/3806_1 /TAXON_ID=163516 /ORGANISM="Leptocylindrus danicus var. danicus, Strain B650" /LENGTH=533 /DNA_ID=CAMNT_0003479147 /DNA_START=128 /DNA_END=1729 /DNA_ORIENTATION=+
MSTNGFHSERNNLPETLLDKLTSHANSFAAAHGLQVETKGREKGDKVTYETAPVSLLPNAYPASAFENAKKLAPGFSLLVDRVSRDAEFLRETLSGGVAEADPFTGKLLELYEQIYCTEGAGEFAKSADRFGVLRSDYMLHNNNELKQVELNTIASSFAGLASQVAQMHGHLVERYIGEEKDIREWLEVNKRAVMGGDASDDSSKDGVPVSPALTCIPAGMSVVHDRYVSRYCSSSDGSLSPVILFVVQEGETNTVDQRMLEIALWEKHKIPVVRMSLTAGYTKLATDAKTGALSILLDDGSSREVSLVYFRAGYAPTDYPGENGEEWKTREKIELSRATKCPSMGYHLAGAKKVQQALARPGKLERFFSEDEQSLVPGLRSTFAGLYSLGADACEGDKAAVKDAISGQEGNYVLKPQREGGGYNYYGEGLCAKLKENVSGDMELSKELAEFILMERLFPPQQRACLLRAGKVEGFGDSISELGCFGTVVSSESGEIVHNEYAGFLLRTKFSNVDEGGVASGFATLSSPYLCR